MKARNGIFPLAFVVVYATAVVVVPLLYLTYYALHSSIGGLFVVVLKESLWQSFLQASVSTIISLPVGLLVGILLIIYSGRMKNIVISLLLVTYVMPGIVMAIGIISIFGYSSRFWEIIYGNVIYNAPMISVLAFSTGSSTDIREIYSAKTLGAGDIEVISRFYLPNSLRGGMLGGILTFILSFEGFSLPLIIGGPSYSTMEVMIYQLKSVLPTFSSVPFSSASLLGLLQVVILVIPLYVYLSIRSTSRRNDSSLPSPLMRYRRLALSILLLFTAFILVPFFGMFVRYPIWLTDIHSITSKLQISFPALIGNTLLFSFASTFLAFMISIVVTVYRPAVRNQFLILIPLIFSPVTLALSYFLAYGELIPTSLLVILIFTAVIIPLNLRMMIQSTNTVPPSESYSSRILGDRPLATFFKVQLPRIKWEISTVLSLMFITVMGQFSSIVTVYTQSTETITIGIYNLLYLRDLGDTYDLTEIFLIVIFISSLIINQMGKGGSGGQT